MKQIARERFETAWLSNPEIFSVHELPDCSDHAFYATMAEADADASSLVKSLDGAWKAHFAMNPSEAPDTLLTSAALDETLREIQVPCEFQMEAPEWDPPHYVNTQYPWDGHEALQAPQVSEVYNPTVTCIRHFSLSLPQVQQRTVLHLAGVEAAVLVYVNGHEVGYAEDSFTPHRFDLTPYVHVGENRLALRVFKRCTGSWMEDQDFWRFSGIHRSVSLHFYPETHLYDLRVRTPLTDNYTRATLETRLRVMGASLGKAKLTLTDKAGKTLWTAEKPLTALESYVSAEIPGVKLWSAEEPNLYTLTVVLTNAQGQVTEVCRTKVGFRQFEMKDKIMCLNGKRIVFHGVNRHEFDCDRGNGNNIQQGVYHLISRHSACSDADIQQEAGRTTLVYRYTTPMLPDFAVTVRYTVHSQDALDVTVDWPGLPNQPDMPALGLSFQLDPRLTRVRCYGYGPDENYIDRREGAYLGWHSWNAADGMTRYCKPQESGNRTGVQVVSVTDADGHGVEISGDNLEVSVQPWLPEELEAAYHPSDLMGSVRTVLDVAMFRKGIGGDDSWGAPVLPQFCYPADKPYTFTFTMKAL